MGFNQRAIQRDEDDDRQKRDRFASTLVIGACIIAAVRLAREPDVSKPTPRLMSQVYQAVSLARLILDRVLGAK